ncbi:uncharacterized protein Z520_06319 [Fonsecaea multimorphosa CBS 102226]|uniref:Uncharacterized protein n=1 Tax=Fonsecaea multimorphosa CBS 102226 TaxID=1442371 RepID=A0A0D2K4Z2_9EURO|nr:uncharacterized protein Z520_06319 [Fonsecaea multimorphosa CBS 102226]KIX98239.1 hypothetical protein Z520_06319 [Fonsecaea multimorphosa CBS 102226]OAL22627.1 hypothetical protein AYO22_07185 [Fonsecaea multimorphosa]
MVSDFVRLHVTPLTPDLLQVVVGPHLLKSVANLSYHTIQTFPENNYGYFDLPTMEADRLKKKLNGAILKGRKIRVEEARPKKRRRVEELSKDDEPSAELKQTKPKKSKERNVIQGYELPADRKVKRGWTEAKSTKSSKRNKGKAASSSSKYTDKDETLFRTKVPPNKLDGTEAAKKEKGKSKKKDTQQVVHEFEKSTIQPSFLKQDIGLGIKGNLQYVEGEGWVDGQGQLVEREHERVSKHGETSKRRAHADGTAGKRRRGSSQPPSSPSSSSSEDTDEGEVDSSSPEVEQNEDTSSSGSSPDSGYEEETATSASAHDTSEADTQSEIHPLEALFKKPKAPISQDIAKPSLEISTSFSFFNSGDPEDLAEEPVIPLTPFSSQDHRYRGLRSAAPTPDTAHPSRFNSYGSSGLPGDEEPQGDGEDGADEAGLEAKSGSQEKPKEHTSQPQSDFEKKFWENRAENNRSWKLRRRTVLKEKRQRENKARRPRNW